MAMRIWMMLLTAIVAMSFAGGAAADNKRWSVAAQPTAFATANDVTVTITITNQTPNGNANINSLQIALPAGYTVNTSHVGGAPVTTTWPGQLDWTTQSGVIAFSNMAPLANTSFAIVAFLNIDTGTAGCTANAWPGFPSTRAFTGSAFTGTDFTLTSKPTTSVSAAKALAFQNVTSNVPVGTDITGSVTATSCGKVPSPAVSVTVDLLNSANTAVATATGSNGVSIDFPTTTIAPGSYTLKASVPADAGYTAITKPVTVCGNALAFTGQPSNIKLGDADSATIQAKTCGTVAQGVSVTAQLQDSSNKPVGSSQTASTDSSGNVTFQFTPTALGAYTILATATNYSDATSNVFKVFAGILNCNDDIKASFINPDNLGPDQPGYAAGTRNAYNKDGVSEQCKQVLYTFTNTILTNETVNLTWDTALQPNAAFEYTLNWQAQPVESGDKVSGWPMELRPVVAWLNEDGSESTGLSANPAFRLGLACLGNSLPMPYGTLVNAIDDQPGTTSITVTGIASNPSINNPLTNTPYTQPVPGDPAIPAYPFPIVIADTVGGVQDTSTERMLVIRESVDSPHSVNAGQWTMKFDVQRGDGMTTRAAHAIGYRVMSTPLPLIPTDDPTNYPSGGVYAPGTQAHMCIAAHGFTSFDFSGGTAHVLVKTHIFDIGDGWVGLR